MGRQGAVMFRFGASRVHAANAAYGDDALQPQAAGPVGALLGDVEMPEHELRGRVGEHALVEKFAARLADRELGGEVGGGDARARDPWRENGEPADDRAIESAPHGAQDDTPRALAAQLSPGIGR